MKEIHQFNLGAFACTVIHDENGTDTVARLLSEVPEAEREAVLTAKGMSLTEIDLSYNVLLVEANGQRLLLDSGNGVETGGEGRLLPTLEEHGIALDSI
ncbi:MAG: hypothetical protein H7X77_07875, partial [Anaerolineae bacterium]|nr:hypothetical protein [Anaerolineae bacterium]